MTVGAGYGMAMALGRSWPDEEAPVEAPKPDSKPVAQDRCFDLRMNALEARIARLETNEPAVTRAELDAELDRRLAGHEQAVASLRTLVTDTGELLERVIEKLERD